MAAAEGNKYAAYSLDEIRKFCNSFALHIEEGYSDTSFPDCDYRTIYSALEKNQDVLQTEKELIEKAKRKRMMFWEGEGLKLTTGESAGNATAWIFNMKNRFPEEWKDKKEVDNSHEFKNMPTYDQFLNDLKGSAE
jgi:hypothetical protein